MDSKIARIVLSEALGDLSFAKFVNGGRKNILLKLLRLLTLDLKVTENNNSLLKLFSTKILLYFIKTFFIKKFFYKNNY